MDRHQHQARDIICKILQGLRVDSTGLTYFRRVRIPAEGLLKSHRP